MPFVPFAAIVPVAWLLIVESELSVLTPMAMPPGFCAEAIVPAFWISPTPSVVVETTG